MPTEVLPNELLQEGNAPDGEDTPENEEEPDESSSTPSGGLRRQTSVQRELADAIVRLGSIEELKILIECGANINDSVTQGLKPLHYAVWQRYQEAAEFLLEEGCDINALDDIGYSALHLSAEHGYLNMVELLLKHEAQVNFNIPVEGNEYPLDVVDEPLRLALKHDHFEVAKVLLEHGANPSTCYFFGHEINLISPFNIELLNLLLSYGADPNARDRQSFTPLMKACRLHQDSAEQLQNQESISGKEILLHFAQTLMGMEAVLLLISFGADVNLRTDVRHDFRSVLHCAVLSGSVPIANLLIKQNAQVNFEPEYRRPSPLDLAILKGDVSMVQLLLDSGADLKSSSPIIGTALHMACSDGITNRTEILKMLLERGANPNQIVYNEDDKPLRTVLGEYLSISQELDIADINLLLKYGAEVVMQNQNHDPRGILSDIPNLSKYPKVLITLLEAAQKFDLHLIINSSKIEDTQRNIYLTVGKSPQPLKHLVRIYLRRFFQLKLPTRVDELEIPTILKKYLLYEIS